MDDASNEESLLLSALISQCCVALVRSSVGSSVRCSPRSRLRSPRLLIIVVVGALSERENRIAELHALLEGIVDNSGPRPVSLKHGRQSRRRIRGRIDRPPTLSPTDAPTVSITKKTTICRETPTELVGLALLVAVYAFSVLFSTCYIKQSRNAMEHKHEMEKSTTIEPDIRGGNDDFLADATTTAR